MSDGSPKEGRNTIRTRIAVLHLPATRTCLLLLTLFLVSGPILAAGFTCPHPPASHSPPPSTSELPELDEVVVTPERSANLTRELATWLRLLEGQYSYEGHVDLCGNGNPADQRPVTGKADCMALYDSAAPLLLNLYCVINVRWPRVLGADGKPVLGGESSLSPAVVVYGVKPNLSGIQSFQIDSKGVATQARGKLVGNTLTTKESCGAQESCQKITRITARPNSHDISILVDIQINSRRVLTQDLLLHRQSSVESRWKPRTRMLTLEDLLLVGER